MYYTFILPISIFTQEEDKFKQTGERCIYKFQKEIQFKPYFMSVYSSYQPTSAKSGQDRNAPFRKISNSAQCGIFALILWRLVKGFFFWCFLGKIVTWQYNPNLFD